MHDKLAAPVVDYHAQETRGECRVHIRRVVPEGVTGGCKTRSRSAIGWKPMLKVGSRVMTMRGSEMVIAVYRTCHGVFLYSGRHVHIGRTERG